MASTVTKKPIRKTIKRTAITNNGGVRKTTVKARSNKAARKKHPIHKRILMHLTQRGATRKKVMPILFVIAFAGIGVYFLIRSQAASGDYAHTTCKKDSTYANCLDNSAHSKVTRLYLAVYDRQPDASGYDYWVKELVTKPTTLQTVADSFVSSNEFKTRYPNDTNRNYVTRLYQNVMGRQPDTEGLNYWTAQLDQKKLTRAQVLLQFTESKENISVQSNKIRCFVAALCDRGYLYKLSNDELSAQSNLALHIVSPDMKLTRKIYTGSYYGDGFTWSSDGKSILYTENSVDSNSGRRIKKMNSDGSNQTALTANTTGVMDSSPRMSPDGKYIAFGRFDNRTSPNDTSNQSGVWIMNANGSNQKRVVDTNDSASGGNTSSVGGWKDATTIAYSTFDYERSTRYTAIKTVNITDNRVIVLLKQASSSPINDITPDSVDWNSNRTKLLYMKNDAAYTVNTDGTGTQKYGNCSSSIIFFWSHDNNSITDWSANQCTANGGSKKIYTFPANSISGSTYFMDAR